MHSLTKQTIKIKVDKEQKKDNVQIRNSSDLENFNQSSKTERRQDQKAD